MGHVMREEVMGEVLTRVYRNGALEAEGFLVADVSEYLEQPTRRCGWTSVVLPGAAARAFR
jgi:hypothetical protein